MAPPTGALPDLISAASVPTMSTLEIAEQTGKEHRNVMRDTRIMLTELYGEGGVLSFEQTHRNPQNGQEYPIFCLPKRECLILVSGYSVALRARIIDRWQELEGRSQTSLAIPNFADPAAAARAWAEQYEGRVLAERKRVEIGSRREATAMATAAHANRRAKRLEIELGRSREYASIKLMEAQHRGREFDWRLLKRISQEKGLLPVEVFDANYGKVNSYHAEVWRTAYAVEITEGAVS